MHFISSSAIKELIYHNADITPYVPHELVNIIVRKYQQIIK
jgi:pantetheine-phosphate adenylyltransferase